MGMRKEQGGERKWEQWGAYWNGRQLCRKGQLTAAVISCDLKGVVSSETLKRIKERTQDGSGEDKYLTSLPSFLSAAGYFPLAKLEA